MSDWAKSGKAMLLINLKPGVSREAFMAFFASDRRGAGTVVDDGAARAALIDRTEIDGLSHQLLMADSPPPFEAAYQLRSPDTGDLEKLSSGIAQVVEQLAGWIDRERSALLVGTEIMITRGWGPIEIIMPLRRRPELSHDEFMENWYGRHASIGEAVENVRYRQNHVNADLTGRLARSTGITFEEMDGVAESFFLTPQEAIKIMSGPEVAVAAIEDEKKFIDHSRSQFGFYRILE